MTTVPEEAFELCRDGGERRLGKRVEIGERRGDGWCRTHSGKVVRRRAAAKARPLVGAVRR